MIATDESAAEYVVSGVTVRPTTDISGTSVERYWIGSESMPWGTRTVLLCEVDAIPIPDGWARWTVRIAHWGGGRCHGAFIGRGPTLRDAAEHAEMDEDTRRLRLVPDCRGARDGRVL